MASPTLTKYDKNAIVKQILADTPKIDYEEQARALLIEERLRVLPAILTRVWEDPTLRGFLDTSYCHKFGLHGTPFNGVEIPAVAAEKVEALLEQSREQREARNELRVKLGACFASVRTAKQFVERFPEFEKYLPETAAKSVQLPAIANLLADLTAAGWPKAA